MCASDVTATLDRALAASGLDHIAVAHRPRLLSDDGASYVAGDLADWLESNGMQHVRGAPYHPQTQGKGRGSYDPHYGAGQMTATTNCHYVEIVLAKQTPSIDDRVDDTHSTASMCQNVARQHRGEPSTMHHTIIGLDLAKNVFQVHGVDAAGKAVLRKKLRRSELIAFFTKLPSCVIGIEACGTAHYWGRELTDWGIRSN